MGKNMGMVADITPNRDYLHVRVTGDFLLIEANDVLRRIFMAIDQHALSKVLIDCRQVKGNPTTMERFEHAKFVSREKLKGSGAPGSVRLVYVGTEPLIERQDGFGETVALNRGVAVKETDNLEEALRWLGIDLADPALETADRQIARPQG
jgi:hypothetical protein